ncbi:MAG: universal stress protein [Nitrosomonadaceae bacterium]
MIRITTEFNADLIVLGAQSYTGWNRYIGMSGTVAKYLVKYAPCAVFTIKP